MIINLYGNFVAADKIVRITNAGCVILTDGTSIALPGTVQEIADAINALLPDADLPATKKSARSKVAD